MINDTGLVYKKFNSYLTVPSDIEDVFFTKKEELTKLVSGSVAIKPVEGPIATSAPLDISNQSSDEQLRCHALLLGGQENYDEILAFAGKLGIQPVDLSDLDLSVQVPKK